MEAESKVEVATAAEAREALFQSGRNEEFMANKKWD
jgi:hypothetical protein